MAQFIMKSTLNLMQLLVILYLNFCLFVFVTYLVLIKKIRDVYRLNVRHNGKHLEEFTQTIFLGLNLPVIRKTFFQKLISNVCVKMVKIQE